MHKRWTIEQWRRVLWSDEATFTVSDNNRKYIYQTHGSNPLDPCCTRHTVKHPDSLMVWGSFSYSRVGSLVFLYKNVKMNHYNYLELLCDHLLCQSAMQTHSCKMGPPATLQNTSQSGLMIVMFPSLIPGLAIPWI